MITIATTTATRIQRVCVVTAPACHARRAGERGAGPAATWTNGPLVRWRVALLRSRDARGQLAARSRWLTTVVMPSPRMLTP